MRSNPRDPPANPCPGAWSPAAGHRVGSACAATGACGAGDEAAVDARGVLPVGSHCERGLEADGLREREPHAHLCPCPQPGPAEGRLEREPRRIAPDRDALGLERAAAPRAVDPNRRAATGAAYEQIIDDRVSRVVRGCVSERGGQRWIGSVAVLAVLIGPIARQVGRTRVDGGLGVVAVQGPRKLSPSRSRLTALAPLQSSSIPLSGASPRPG